MASEVKKRFSLFTCANYSTLVPLLIELCLSLFLNSPNLVHSHPVPPVQPAKYLTVEVSEQPRIHLLNSGLYGALESEPLELHFDQLVAAHDGFGSLLPVRFKWAAVCLLRAHLCRVPLRLVVLRFRELQRGRRV
jgi:hypothetical protein